MALVFADLVQENTSTTGTGTLTLTGAVTGCQTFAAIGNANTTYYRIISGNDSEIGIGTYTLSGTTLARTTILSTIVSGVSAGTSPISIASGATVICTYPAERAVLLDASNKLTLSSDAVVNGVTIGLGKSSIDSNFSAGVLALSSITTGAYNTGAGRWALKLNTTGSNNTGFGFDALYSCVSGADNTSFGANSLSNLTLGSGNIGIGYNAGVNAQNTDYVVLANTSLFIGNNTQPTTGANTNEIVIGDSAIGNGSNTATLGNTSITDNYLSGNIRCYSGSLYINGIWNTGTILSTSSILCYGAGGIGYSTGAGIAVSQTTSRTTQVPSTTSHSCGQITVFTGAWVVGTYATFIVPNTSIALTDTIVCTIQSGANIYNVNANTIVAGTSFKISIASVSGVASEAPKINFTIIKGVAS